LIRIKSTHLDTYLNNLSYLSINIKTVIATVSIMTVKSQKYIELIAMNLKDSKRSVLV